MGYYESLDGFPALDAAQALTQPALTRIDGGALGCQTAQSDTQWVPMHDPDQAQPILRLGPSEWLSSPRPTADRRQSATQRVGTIEPAAAAKEAHWDEAAKTLNLFLAHQQEAVEVKVR